jgi:hypothetical protein
MTDPSGQRERMLRATSYLAADPELAPARPACSRSGTRAAWSRPL